MANINDTVTFPITQPRKEDFVIGTDISDTGNSPNGETVNFKFEDILDIADKHSSWHYYDSENYGDSADGVIYDFDTDGAVSTITTPAFVDGYEYGIAIENLSISANSGSTSIRLNYQDATTSDILIFTNPTIFSVSGSVSFYISNTRQFSRSFSKKNIIEPVASTGATLTSDEATSRKAGITKVDTFTIFTTSGSFDSGVIRLIRRRDLLS